MSEPYVGEIRMFAGNFAPRGWAFCDGQLLTTNQNDALFSLLGTIYGGDGRSTFGLPDLRGRIPMHAGAGPGLTNRSIGQRGGAEEETLTINQLPSHTHQLVATSATGDSDDPTNRLLAQPPSDNFYTAASNADTTLAADAVSNAGSSASVSNLMPTLCINFIIALIGIYPSRT
ncbi:MAG: tail fiber protein [Cyanobacteria bacterium J06642_11]